MKQSVEIGETGSLGGKRRKTRIPHRPLIVHILENDNQHAVEVMRFRPRGCPRRFLFLSFLRFRDFRLRLAWR